MPDKGPLSVNRRDVFRLSGAGIVAGLGIGGVAFGQEKKRIAIDHPDRTATDWNL